MKAKELRLMSEPELDIKSGELKKELMKVNSQIAVGTIPKSPGKVGGMKRTIAQILTIKKENARQKKGQTKGAKKE
jgi:large subunit ribosomal protein L29